MMKLVCKISVFAYNIQSEKEVVLLPWSIILDFRFPNKFNYI